MARTCSGRKEEKEKIFYRGTGVGVGGRGGGGWSGEDHSGQKSQGGGR